MQDAPHSQTPTARKGGIVPFDQTPRWLMILPINPGAKVVYSYLHRLALQFNGEVHPKVETIAEETGIGRVAIFRHIESLKNVGALQTRNRRNKTKQTSNQFYVMFNSPVDLVPRLIKHKIKIPKQLK